MSEVKRYNNVEAQHLDGLLVLASDYDALLQRVAELKGILHAADILAHDVTPGDNREALDRWWKARGGLKECTVCHPVADGAEHD